MNDPRFYYPQPQDLRSDLSYKHEQTKGQQMFEIENGIIKCLMPLKTEKLIVNEISSDNGVIIVNGTLKVENLEVQKHLQITTMEFKNNQILDGDLTVTGNFNVNGDVNWTGKTNYVDTQIIRAEDNIINLNYKGTHETSKMGGIRLIKGIDDTRDAYMVIDDTGYWNIYPGINVPVLNVETINFEEEEDGMLIGYLNGNKIGIKYKSLE
jgi:hypothetical protein